MSDFGGLGAWTDGTVMAVLTLLVVRPVVLMLMLQPVRLRTGERVFLSLAGLKGAVPILLGSFVVTGHAAAGRSIYAIVFVVVAASVLVQATFVPWMARRCGVPMEEAPPLRPWPLGIRFRSPPQGVRRSLVQPGAAAEDRRVSELDLPEGLWIALVIRKGTLLTPRPGTRLSAGDEVVPLVDPSSDVPDDAVNKVFGTR